MNSARSELPTKEDGRLQPVYQSMRLWNGVAITSSGRVFVSYPSSDQPGVGAEELLADGSRRPFPDLRWNAWMPGESPDRSFVHVNALRIGPEGDLWIVDAGSPGIGKPAVPGGARIIRINLGKDAIARIYDLGKAIGPNGYADDVRFNGEMAYITDAGEPGLITLNLKTGEVRRVLDHDPSTVDERPMYADEKLLKTKEGKELRAHADQLEVSPDGKYLYYQPASGPMSRIETRWLDDATLSASEIAKQVEKWVDTPTSGGTAIDAKGNIYLSDPKVRRILKITPTKEVSTLIADPRLIWSDAMWIDKAGFLWIPATQQNLTPGFSGGKQEVKYPVWIYKMQINEQPAPNDHS